MVKFTLNIQYGDEMNKKIEAFSYEGFLEELGTIERSRVLKCPHCYGDGYIELSNGDDVAGVEECEVCNGEGYVTIKEIEEYDKED